MAWFMLSDGLSPKQLAELEDLVYRPIEEGRPDADSAAALAAMNQPFTVVQ